MSARLLWAQGLLPRSLRAGGTNSLLATETLATRLLTSTRLTTTLLTGCGSLLPKPAALPVTYAGGRHRVWRAACCGAGFGANTGRQRTP